MNGYFAFFRKEVREHRLLLIALFALVPLLTIAVFWVSPHLRDRMAAEHLHLISLGLVALGLGAVLFSGERRRGTLDLLRRTPGAFRAAFAAKWSLYALTAILIVVWQAVWLGLIGRAHGLREHIENGYLPNGTKLEMPLVEELLLFPRYINVEWALLIAAVGIWVALASLWLVRGGANTILGPLALLILGAPVLWVSGAHPYYFGVWQPGAPALLAWIFGGLGLLVAITTYFGGMRFVNRTARAIRRGLIPALVLLLAGYAWSAVSLSRHLDLQPEDPDFKVLVQRPNRYPTRSGPFLSPNGRFLYVEAYRGVPWPPQWRYYENEIGYAHFLDGRGTRSKPWMVDLETGENRPLTEGFGGLESGCGRMGYWDPTDSRGARLPHLSVWQDGDDSSQPRTWVEADTGEIERTKPGKDAFRSPRLPELEVACIQSARRDAAGRWTWIKGGRIFREGDEDGEPLLLDGREVTASFVQLIPGGWQVHLTGGGSARVTVDADTGRLRPLPSFEEETLVTVVQVKGTTPGLPAGEHAQPQQTMRVLGPLSAVLMRGQIESEASTAGLWGLVDLESGETRDLPRGPESDLTSRIASVADTLVCLSETDGALRPVLWRPGEASSFDAIPYDGPSLDGAQDLTFVMRDEKGRAVYRVARDFPYVPEATYLVHDPVEGRFLAATPWTKAIGFTPDVPLTIGLRPIVFEEDGRLLAVEDDGTGGGTVVRLGPASLEREVVFPPRE